MLSEQAGRHNGSPAKLFFRHLAAPHRFLQSPDVVSKGWSSGVTREEENPVPVAGDGLGPSPSASRAQIYELVLINSSSCATFKAEARADKEGL